MHGRDAASRGLSILDGQRIVRQAVSRSVNPYRVAWAHSETMTASEFERAIRQVRRTQRHSMALGIALAVTMTTAMLWLMCTWTDWHAW